MSDTFVTDAPGVATDSPADVPAPVTDDPFAVPPEINGRHAETLDLHETPSSVTPGHVVAVFQAGRCVATFPAGCELFEADEATGRIVRRIEPGEDLSAIVRPI